jgi:hypothetical protein
MSRELEKEVKMAVTGQTPNKAMQRTARKRTIHFMRVCHPPAVCVDRFSGLAVADLLSR